MSFRNRLIKAYTTSSPGISRPLAPSIYETSDIWCPISGKRCGAYFMKAAHIIPHSIGAANAAYLFGYDPSAGWDVIWSERNGLMMNHSVETLFDNGQMVIIPDPTDDGEFMSIILSLEILKDDRPTHINGMPLRTLHKKRLQFQMSARPEKSYLYVHMILSLFRRRRYAVPGWEKDREQVLTGRIWASPSKRARRSMIEALALEVGDSWEGAEAVDALTDFPETKSVEEEKRIATVMEYTMDRRATDSARKARGEMVDDDDESDASDEEEEEEEHSGVEEDDDDDWRSRL